MLESICGVRLLKLDEKGLLLLMFCVLYDSASKITQIQMVNNTSELYIIWITQAALLYITHIAFPISLMGPSWLLHKGRGWCGRPDTFIWGKILQSSI